MVFDPRLGTYVRDIGLPVYNPCSGDGNMELVRELNKKIKKLEEDNIELKGELEKAKQLAANRLQSLEAFEGIEKELEEWKEVTEIIVDTNKEDEQTLKRYKEWARVAIIYVPYESEEERQKVLKELEGD